MSKVISFDNLKRIKKNIEDIHEEKDYQSLMKATDIYRLIEESKIKEALDLAEITFSEFGYSEKVCEAFVYSIVINGDHFDDESFEKYYIFLRDIYNKFTSSEKIASMSFSFFLPKMEMIKKIEGEDFDFYKLFKEIYDNFPENENIIYHYSCSFLLSLDLYDTEALSNHEKIFDTYVEKYVKLLLDSGESDDIVAVEFSKYLYLASIKSESNSVIKKALKLLKDISADYEEDEEIITYYCLYISKHMITDNSIHSMKAVNEFKAIIKDYNSFVLSEILFLSLYNLVSTNDYENSKFALSQMKSIIYSLEDFEDRGKHELVELYAESLSNCSCDQNLSVLTINNEILPLVSALIKDFGQTENLVVEYCIILYNIACLISYYEGEDAPHIDVMEELKNCADFFDKAIPYYCLGLSNLIHLNKPEFGYDVVNTIKSYVTEFDDMDMPLSKNNISLLSIYVMAITNLLHLLPAEDARPLLLDIVKLVDADAETLDINLEQEFDEVKIQLLFQYIRALAYYLDKLDPLSYEAISLNLTLHNLDTFLSEQEL